MASKTNKIYHKMLFYLCEQIKINITMHRVLKNLAMSLQILNLDSLKILLSKYLQHGPLQDRHISKAREAPSVSGGNVLHLSVMKVPP